MRVFSQNDQDVYRFYDSGGTAASEFGQPRYMEYGVVPDSTTQTDQLKISADLNDDNKLYAFLFAGNTHKESDIVPPIAPTGRTAFEQPDVGRADEQPPIQRRRRALDQHVDQERDDHHLRPDRRGKQ